MFINNIGPRGSFRKYEEDATLGVHAAIRSDELIADYKRIYASHIKVTGCPSSE